MKNKAILIATIVYFLLINTIQLWGNKLGLFAIIGFLFMIIYFFILLLLLIYQLSKSYIEKFKEQKRLILIALITIVLTTSFLYPRGLINFNQFDSEDLFIAQKEGSANCMITLKLKANNRFLERNVCFGITEITGNYRISGDTIHFENISLDRYKNEFDKYAIIRQENTINNSLGNVTKFKNKFDTIGVTLRIIKNELNK